MLVFAKFDEIPSMILEVIKETKRYGHMVRRTIRQPETTQTQFAGGIITDSQNYSLQNYRRTDRANPV